MNLRELRIMRGLGLTLAAEEIGISYGALERAEEGCRVRIATAYKLAKFYGLDPVEVHAELVDGRDGSGDRRAA